MRAAWQPRPDQTGTPGHIDLCLRCRFQDQHNEAQNDPTKDKEQIA